jgi:hypothetical protein
MIDLRRDSRVNDAVSAISRSDLIGAIARLNDDRQALDVSNDRRSLRRGRRSQTTFN